MSEPSNKELADDLNIAAEVVDSTRGRLGEGFAAMLRLAAQRLEASPSTEAIIEWMARAIFNQHNRLTPENSTWHVVPEQTREIFRGIARHELETGQ